VLLDVTNKYLPVLNRHVVILSLEEVCLRYMTEYNMNMIL